MIDKFKNFDEMITPGIINIVYWISLAFVAIASIIGLLAALMSGEFGAAIGTLFFAAFGFLMVRIYCELIILGFKAVEYLKNINDKLNAPNRSSELDEFGDY